MSNLHIYMVRRSLHPYISSGQSKKRKRKKRQKVLQKGHRVELDTLIFQFAVLAFHPLLHLTINCYT